MNPGNEFMPTFVDHFLTNATIWLSLFPTPNGPKRIPLQLRVLNLQLLQLRIFIRDGLPCAVVTDNGSHFNIWRVDCRHSLTSPCHLQSNGCAKNFVKTLQNAINPVNAQTLLEFERYMDNFIVHYRNSVNAATGTSPEKS